jgi:pilus assembly protein CpaB
MDRRKRTVVVMIVAVAMAAAASFGVYLTIKRIPVREVEIAKTFVVVAARPLPTGVRISADDVRLAAWPASSVVSGSFSAVDDVVNRGLLSAAISNEPIVEAKLAPRAAGAGLPPSIPAGMRAMSVKVNDVIGVAGFIDPGTRVDLVVTMRKKDETESRTVVSNVQVLAAGRRADQQKPKDGKPGAAATTAVVTLLVSPSDAERVALAQAEGSIMLVMRNPLDNEPTATTGVRTAMLLGHAADDPPPPAPKAPKIRKPAVVEAVAPSPPPPPLRYTVEAIRAAKRTEEVVQ